MAWTSIHGCVQTPERGSIQTVRKYVHVHRGKPLLLLLAIAPLVTCAQDAILQDTVRTLGEHNVVYLADQLTPITFQDLGKDDLSIRSHGQEPSAVLAGLPSISFYSDAGSGQGYSYLRLRGIDQTRVNMSYDGMPLNEPEDQGFYFSNLPDILNSVSRVQVQRGVGTTKNGVASFAGSVELSAPSLYDSTRTSFSAGIGSFNTSCMNAEYNSGVDKGRALYVRASNIHSDGYRYHTRNDSRSLSLIGGAFGKRSHLKLTLIAGEQRNRLGWLGVPDSLIAVDPKTNVNGKEEADAFCQGVLLAQYVVPAAEHAILSASVYGSFVKGNYDFDLNAFLGLRSTSELYNYTLSSRWTGGMCSIAWTKGRSQWTSGIHGHAYRREHVGSEATLGELYRNTGRKQEVSAFTKVQHRSGNLVLFADVQARHTALDYAGAVPLSPLRWTFLNPKVGTSFLATKRLVLYYCLGRTGREPTRNDLFMGNDDLLSDSLGQALVANSAPESVLDHEAGARWTTPRAVVNINAYHMVFDNEILLEGQFGPNGLALTRGVEHSTRSGIEVFAELQVSTRTRVSTSACFNHGRIAEQGASFAPVLTPKYIFDTRLAWHATGHLLLGAVVRGQDRSFIDLANTRTIAAFAVLDLLAEYRLRRWCVGLFAYNMTNARYATSGYVADDGRRRSFVQATRNGFVRLIFSF